MVSERFQPASRPNAASRRRRRPPRIAAVPVAGALVLGGLTGCGSGDLSDAEAEIGAAKNEVAVQKAMQKVVKAGYPGVMVSVKGKDGETRDYSAGVGDRETGEAPPKNGHMRIASNTKTFVAATVLQLVGEGKLKLDAPIDTYLPGVVRGPDYSGANITVRHLLGHSSGIPDYTAALVPDTAGMPTKTYTAEQLLAPALKAKAVFPVGKKREYSNTNYVIAGMLIEKATGKPVGDAVTERVIDRLGLEDTHWPKPGDTNVPKPRMEGYTAPPGGKLKNVTGMNPSISGAAGMIVSRPRDLSAFFAGLVGGRLMPAEQLREMQKTVESPGSGMPNTTYGLGLDEMTLSCGRIWGHGGDIHGYQSRGGVTTDGREVTVVVNALPAAIISKQSSMEAMEKEAMQKMKVVMDLVDTAICE
ncbi:class A beta-lactamase-related serine hydrolase [Actinomadura sp. KC345]|uniref:serine hydrolase domain-containing protein n=1 Tax=Actinomadura sp. KC345 TaxID=2530371 RepID=UPI00104530D7|nr:serine hydrolase domain-containing protein [Actinomadura sp. KC345]TDC48409.1 class A beta-lactamase-related serine hydrolase [Actinomadura sp. KC345]